MITKKAGTILLNLKTKKVGLIFREKMGDYSFPKGHLEEGETLKECAIRETEEETGRSNYIISDKEIAVLKYNTSSNEQIECYMYFSIDDGESKKVIKEEDKEVLIWTDFEDVRNKLSFENLIDLWNNVKDDIEKIFNSIYAFENIYTKNMFFIKPYDFNGNIISKEEINLKLNEVKKLLNITEVAQVKQEHTDIIKKVTLDNFNENIVADGMITNLKGIGLATKVADCQAILLYDPVNGVIGNVHSGWKGTIQKIIKNAVDIMVNDYDSNLKDIKVVICPSIGKCHFEVDTDVYLKFKDSFNELDINDYTNYKKDINKYYIDTINLNKDYLIYLGLDSNNIEISSICTLCHNDTLHSYRSEKENSGRNLAIIAL